MRNLSYDEFLGHFDAKKGVATARARNSLGPPTAAKKLAHWFYLVDQPLSRNYISN